MFLHVVEVEYLEEYRLRITFNDGAVKDVDLQGKLNGEIFRPLQDPDFFKQGIINRETNTIEWPNGADFAPEYLYEIGEPIPQPV